MPRSSRLTDKLETINFMTTEDTETNSPSLFARAPLTEQVLAHLGNLVADGTWPPGTTLPAESELCASLGVSRALLRECIRVLASRGVLAARQGKGTFVCPPSAWNIGEPLSLAVRADETQLQNWIEVRGALEAATASLAAVRCDADDGADLRSRLADLAAAGGAPSYLEADIAFHLSVARASHNPQFVRLLGPLLRPLREQLFTNTADIPHLRRVGNQEHSDIAAAIFSHDASAAMHAATAHILRVVDEFALVTSGDAPGPKSGVHSEEWSHPDQHAAGTRGRKASSTGGPHR